MTIEIVNQLPVEKWRLFVDNHPEGTIFHTPEMFQVYSHTRNHRPELWAACKDDQILTLMLPVEITLINTFMRPYTIRSVVYGGLLTTSGQEGQEALKSLLLTYNQAKRGRILFTELRHQSDISEIQSILLSSNYAFEEHSNYLVDLSIPVDQVWKNIHTSARKKIKQAQKGNALIIEETNSIDLLPIWYEILKQSFSRAHVPLVDYLLFKSAFDILYPLNMIRFYTGRIKDDYISASVRLFYKQTIYAWFSGFNRKYGVYRPNEIMTWYVIKYGAENGYRTFDFGGAGKPNEYYGPRVFKAKFGGELVNYGRSTCVHSPFSMKLSKIGYQILRKYIYD